MKEHYKDEILNIYQQQWANVEGNLPATSYVCQRIGIQKWHYGGYLVEERGNEASLKKKKKKKQPGIKRLRSWEPSTFLGMVLEMLQMIGFVGELVLLKMQKMTMKLSVNEPALSRSPTTHEKI